MEEGVHVIRIGLPSVDRSKLHYRFLQYFCYQVGATIASFGQKYDVVLAANPFLTVWLPFAASVVLRHKPALYSIHDVYPNVGVTLGVFRNKTVIAAAAGMERFCLDHSRVVRILSESFRPAIRALGVPDSKISLVYDWVDTSLIQPFHRNNSFAEEHTLTDRFVVLYAGNIGRSQGLEHVLHAAGKMTHETQIRFVFVGDGASRKSLIARAKQCQLSNVQFIPFQPRERLPEVLASADISLVSLSKGVGYGSLPSKLYSIFASGRPVLASIDEGCETWELISKAEAGLCIPPETPEKLAEAILKLKNNPGLREQLGQNGRLWAEKYHSPRSAAEQFENLLFAALSDQEQ
jgi:colanic acid biosynthesis glycosyl transferase WcaI